MNIKRCRHIAVVAVLAVGLVACGSGATGTDGTSGQGTKSIANVVPGALGDQAFYDDAESGVKSLKSAGYKTTTLQADANNPAQWKANLQSVSTGEWGLVVMGSSTAADTMSEIAPKFPNQKFVFYDGVIDAPNVASFVYKQNEGSFLAGVLAALATSDVQNFPLSAGSKTIGLVGGMDIPVIHDFAEGFKAGAKAVDPSVRVLTSYIGSFTDSAKGYDQAKAMFDQKADVVYQVAGGAGLGVLQAAKDAKKYAIGVDSNQNKVHAGHVLASMQKHVGESLIQVAGEHDKGAFPGGKTTSFGLANNGVGLTYEDNGGLVPQVVVDKVEEYKKKVVGGEIKVPTALG